MSSAMAVAADREALLDELEVLAGVEHALVVEWLTVGCALGTDLPAEEGGPVTDAAREAVTTAALRASDEMRHLSHVCRALAGAGRTPSLDRAADVPAPGGGVLDLAPSTPTDAAALLARAEALAGAVDARYARLAPSVDAAGLGDTLGGILGDGGSHS